MPTSCVAIHNKCSHSADYTSGSWKEVGFAWAGPGFKNLLFHLCTEWSWDIPFPLLLPPFSNLECCYSDEPRGSYFWMSIVVTYATLVFHYIIIILMVGSQPGSITSESLVSGTRYEYVKRNKLYGWFSVLSVIMGRRPLNQFRRRQGQAKWVGPHTGHILAGRGWIV